MEKNKVTFIPKWGWVPMIRMGIKPQYKMMRPKLAQNGKYWVMLRTNSDLNVWKRKTKMEMVSKMVSMK